MQRVHIYEDLDGTVGVLNKKPDFEVQYLTYSDLHKDQVKEILNGDMTLPKQIMADYKEPRLDL